MFIFKKVQYIPLTIKIGAERVKDVDDARKLIILE